MYGLQLVGIGLTYAVGMIGLIEIVIGPPPPDASGGPFYQRVRNGRWWIFLIGTALAGLQYYLWCRS